MDRWWRWPSSQMWPHTERSQSELLLEGNPDILRIVLFHDEIHPSWWRFINSKNFACCGPRGRIKAQVTKGGWTSQHHQAQKICHDKSMVSLVEGVGGYCSAPLPTLSDSVLVLWRHPAMINTIVPCFRGIGQSTLYFKSSTVEVLLRCGQKRKYLPKH